MMKLVAAPLHQSCSPEALLLIGVEKNITATASSQYNYLIRQNIGIRLCRNKDGLTCTVTVELDGKVPGLPTSSMPTPSHAWRRHARRPYKAGGLTMFQLLSTA